MRVLLLTGSPARYMAPPSSGETQIVAGPDWPDAQTPDGHWLSLRTPVGDYDLATLLAKIPADQQPDTIVNLIDATWRNRPRRFATFAGAKTLLIVDSEQLEFPLAELFSYTEHEKFERVVFLRSLEHLGQFLADLADEFAAPEPAFTHHDRPQLVRAS